MSRLDAVKQKWRGLKTWQKFAVVIGGLVAVRVVFGGGVRAVTFLRQGTVAGNLGTSSVSISGSGCFLTALTMAANTLKGASLSVSEANSIITRAGGFSGASLVLETAARALGLVARESDRIRSGSSKTLDSMRQRIEETLARGGMPILNVDKTYTGTGEHFILCRGRTSKGYACADPATGTDTFIDPATLRGVAMWGSTPHEYDVVGVAPVFAG